MKLLIVISALFIISVIPISYALDISNQQIVGDNSKDQTVLLEFGESDITETSSLIFVKPNLEFGWIDSNSGTYILENVDATISERGTIRIHSSDPPAILYAHYLGDGNYKINFYAVENGLLEKTMYNAELIEKAETQSISTTIQEQLTEKKNLFVDTNLTSKSKYYDNFNIDVFVWDADINPNPEFFSKTDGKLADIPVTVILTAPNGDKFVTMEGVTDSYGKYEGKYRWGYNDFLGDYKVSVDIDNGNYVEEFKTFYDGYVQADEKNLSPIARAGGDQSVPEHDGGIPTFTVVSLTGSGSSAQEGRTLVTFAWVQTAGTAVAIADDTAADTTFTAPNIAATETLTFALTVTDNFGLTDNDTVNIEITFVD